MQPSQILEDQIIHVKRGRFNSFGFEPAWNAYFDFYLSPKYIDPPLLQLEDVTFHLFLRKNLNDRDPSWKMPSVRQMMRRLDIGQRKIEAMMQRLDGAHLLQKVSGLRKGESQSNIPNHYILSDPIQTLEEFLTVAAAEIFLHPLKTEWMPLLDEDPVREMHTGVRETHEDPVRETQTLKQTVFLKTEDRIWQNILLSLKQTLPSASFASFVADTRLVSVEGGIAAIATPRTFAVDWLENRLSHQIRRMLSVEMGVKIERVKVEVLTESPA